MTQPSTSATHRTFEKIANGRYQVLQEDGKVIGTVRSESAYWWAYDLQGDKIQGGQATAQLAAALLPGIPSYVCEICGEDGETCAHSLNPKQTVTITVELDGEGAALDTGRQLLVRADALERSFKFAAEGAPVRRTIANLRAVAAALMAQAG